MMGNEWTQTADKVNVQFKTHSLKKAQVEFAEQTLTLSFTYKNRLPESEVLVRRLYGAVWPDQCDYSLQNGQLHVELTKQSAENWPSLEAAAGGRGEFVAETPRSSRRTTDWDQLCRQLEKDEPDEKDASDVFKQLYACGDDSAKRAMIKSFTESNGTVLSMNWNEVVKEKTKPYDD